MSDPASRVIELEDALQDEGAINTEVTGVGALSRFDESFRKYDFRYGKPYVMLNLDTDMDEIQVLIGVKNLINTPLESGLTDSNLEGLIGERVNIRTNDSFRHIHFDSHGSTDGDVPTYRPRVKKTMKVKFAGKHAGLLRTCTNSIDRAESIIENCYLRRRNPYEWMEVELNYREKQNETVIYATKNDRELSASWSFNKSMKGTNRLRKFANSLSVIQLLDHDVGKSSAWIKPIWDLNPIEAPKSMLISDDEYWAVCEHPDNINNRSIGESIISLLDPRSDRILFADGSDMRRSKSSQYCETKDWFVRK